jgi:hypothetical protein
MLDFVVTRVRFQKLIYLLVYKNDMPMFFSLPLSNAGLS